LECAGQTQERCPAVPETTLPKSHGEQIFILTKFTALFLATLVITLHPITALDQDTTENHFAISWNICAIDGIMITVTSKL
jgi:hypothetical protein